MPDKNINFENNPQNLLAESLMEIQTSNTDYIRSFLDTEERIEELRREIEHLGLKLKQSHEELGNTNTELMQLTIELDDRVAERTEELEASNKALEKEIKERKKAQRELQKLNTELEERVKARTGELTEVNKELEAFAYSVSHDLRTPLRHISGFIGLLSEKISDSDEEAERYIKTVSESAMRMEEMIEGLLELSRTGRKKLNKVSIDLNKIVEKEIELLSDDWKDRRVDWIYSDLPEVFGDPQMLRNVLMNLLTNALKFTKNRQVAEIKIGAEESKNETIIYVKDNGVGFDMNYVDQIFNVFKRLHRSRDYEGSGIGLANVRRIITRHGGKVWAEGAPDEGAVIYFSLPKKGLT